MRWAASLAMLAAPAIAQVVPAHDVRGWSEDRWFAYDLTVFEAPSLSGGSALDGHRERFRLMVLPSFSRPYIVAIDRSRDGHGTMRLVQANALRGDGRDQIVRTEIRRIAASDWARLNAAIAAARLDARLPRRDPSKDELGAARPPSSMPPLPECVDGERLVFETRTRSGYAVVRRRNCSLDSAMRRLVSTVIALTGQQFLDGIILVPDIRSD